MRKLFLAATVAVLGLTSLNAQEIKFGAKAGLNFASQTFKSKSVDIEIKPDGLTSFHVGVMAELGLSEKLAVQPELLYSIKGSSFKAEGQETKFELGYLSLPIMAKYFVADGISIEAGPQIDFLMSAKAKGNNASVDYKKNYKGIDFGMGLGAGYKMENGLNFGARYNFGLSDIADTSESSDFDEVIIKNNVFQISVGYFF